VGDVIYIRKCPRCKGLGRIFGKNMANASVYSGWYECPRCKGHGRVRERRRARVTSCADPRPFSDPNGE
jgi:DnaJ-class molecular chaperone